MKTIMIRAHHLLCMLGFQGYGYDQTFVENFKNILEILEEDPYYEITIVDESDILCSCCPNNHQGKCNRSSDADSKIRNIDNVLLKRIRLKSGAEYNYRNLINIINTTFKSIDDVEDICGGCNWREDCLWYTSLSK